MGDCRLLGPAKLAEPTKMDRVMTAFNDPLAAAEESIDD